MQGFGFRVSRSRRALSRGELRARAGGVIGGPFAIKVSFATIIGLFWQ